IKPKIWIRYVDDCFGVIHSINIDKFLNNLNSMHKNIKFTLEREHDSQLSFLDVKILRNSNSLETTVYRK
ncbi:hypothetical protein B4U79_07023, partial [Dinothrombium tinctorium]